jgi:C-terminal processing protease CtpA/Prc
LIVGTRTYGAGIGATHYELLDRGIFNVADWGWYDPRDGTWFIKNRGITPDYELEITPAAWRAGRDPQLESSSQWTR